MAAQVLDDFTGEALLSWDDRQVYLVFDRKAVKAIDALIPRGAMSVITAGAPTPSECVVMIMAGSAGYQRRNPGTMRVATEDQAWDVMRDAGGPFVLAPKLMQSLSCAEDLGLRQEPEASDGDEPTPLAPSR